MKKHLILMASLGVMIAGCTPVVSSSETTGPPSSTTDTVKRQDLVGYSFFDGKLVVPATAQAAAFSPFETPVESVPVGVGKYVEKGQTIVKLTIPGSDEAATAAKANVNSAQASLSDERANASQPVKDAQKALDDAKAAEQLAKDTVANGGTADVDGATAARVQAERALKDAQRQLNETLQPSKDALNASAAQLQLIRADARKGFVKAPISGTVVTLEAKPGMTAQANQTLATIVNFEAARVQGTVPPELKDLVQKGSPVIIAMDGVSSSLLDGRVLETKVIPPSEGQTSPGYVAVIRFEKPRQQMVQPTMSVKRVGVKTGEVKNALVVPVGAVINEGQQAYVNVQSGSGWTKTPVTTGISDGALIEIKSGLTEGAVVRVDKTKQS